MKRYEVQVTAGMQVIVEAERWEIDGLWAGLSVLFYVGEENVAYFREWLYVREVKDVPTWIVRLSEETIDEVSETEEFLIRMLAKAWNSGETFRESLTVEERERLINQHGRLFKTWNPGNPVVTGTTGDA